MGQQDQLRVPQAKTRLGQEFQAAVDRYRAWALAPEQEAWRVGVREQLRGKNLVCWCKPLPCHGDVLLTIANSVEALGSIIGA